MLSLYARRLLNLRTLVAGLTIAAVLYLVLYSTLFSTPASTLKLNQFIGQFRNNALTVESAIALAPDGDLDNDQDVDGGDTVRFSYSLKNNTDQDHYLTVLDTAVPTEAITYIRNDHDTHGIDSTQSTIRLPNIPLPARSQKEISFEATVSKISTQTTLSTEPKLYTDNNQLLASSPKQSIKIIRPEKPSGSMVKFTKIKESDHD